LIVNPVHGGVGGRRCPDKDIRVCHIRQLAQDLCQVLRTNLARPATTFGELSEDGLFSHGFASLACNGVSIESIDEIRLPAGDIVK
jgi:hypothetical protein